MSLFNDARNNIDPNGYTNDGRSGGGVEAERLPKELWPGLNPVTDVIYNSLFILCKIIPRKLNSPSSLYLCPSYTMAQMVRIIF